MDAAWWFQIDRRERYGRAGNAGILLRMRRVAWWTACVLLPLLLRLDASASARAIDLLLSVDVPLTLALSLGVTLRARSIAHRRSGARWLWPRAFEPARVRWLFRLRWLGLLQWPAGLALAAMLLSVGNESAPGGAPELLLSALVGLGCGMAAAFAVRERSAGQRREPPSVGHSRKPGLATLARAPFREVREYLDLRRLALLAVPAMLAAPAGASAGDVATGLLVWLPLVWLALVAREAVGVDRALQRWLAHSSLSAASITLQAWLGVAILFSLLLALSLALWWIRP